MRRVLVGASMIDRVPNTMRGVSEPRAGAATRAGLALFRDLALGGMLVHDVTTSELDETLALTMVREAPTGLFLLRRVRRIWCARSCGRCSRRTSRRSCRRSARYGLRNTSRCEAAEYPPPVEIPNDNDPADVPPATVGPPEAEPGDPHGVVVEPGAPAIPPPRVMPSAWSGWPADWTPGWGNSQLNALTDTAWACLDLNSSLLATMPPYLVGASPALDTGWMRNPQPLTYTSWEEFAKQLFWDYQMGEAFVIATAWYATGYPARFHVVPPWTVDVELAGDGTRRYSIGALDVTSDVLHVRYKSTVDDAHGHGPLEAGSARLVADATLSRYAQQFVAGGGIPTSILTHPEELTAKQATDLQAQWVQARMSTIGEPAVLSGGVGYEAIQSSPKDMALVELSQLTESPDRGAPRRPAIPDGTAVRRGPVDDVHERVGAV